MPSPLRVTKQIRLAIIAKAREVAAKGEHEFARKLFATVGICYAPAEFGGE